MKISRRFLLSRLLVGTLLVAFGCSLATPSAVDRDRAAREVLRLTNGNGGATYDLRDGDLAGRPLFAVGMYPDRTKYVSPPLDLEDVATFIENNLDLLSQPGNTVGTWEDPDRNEIVLDVSRTFPTLAEAIEAATEHDQDAVFDLGHGVDILLDPTGDDDDDEIFEDEAPSPPPSANPAELTGI